MVMRNPVLIAIILAGTVFISWLFFQKKTQPQWFISPLPKQRKIKEKPLKQYEIDSLRKTKLWNLKSRIWIGKTIKQEKDFTSRLFYFYSQNKKISGLINLPNKPGHYPIIIMIRGFVDPLIYKTGVGTKHAGEKLARSGFITLSPDFLGYGQSDNPSKDVFEARFQTYTTVLSLLGATKNINQSISKTKHNQIKALPNQIGLWGHSNGGHIALVILEITGKNYPTVLWAPVSKPFPYSILYYTDEFKDHGKALRKKLAEFEENYDVEKYSLPNYLDYINAPIQLHQGEADQSVPQKWSENLFQRLEKMGKEINYFTYPKENHNFSNGSWNTIINRNVSFYKKHLNIHN